MDQIMDTAAKFRSAFAEMKCAHVSSSWQFNFYVQPTFEPGKQGGQICLLLLNIYIYINSLKTHLRPLYNTSSYYKQLILFIRITKINRRYNRINIPHKQQAPFADNTRLNCGSLVYCSGPLSRTDDTALTSTSFALAYPVDYSHYVTYTPK